MPFHIVIPARYGSTRLPGKPLLEIDGKPMIQWVVEAACRSGADEVVVATDDERIVAAVTDARSKGRAVAEMTRTDHASGTDRIAELARRRGWAARARVVNVQGDEPHLPPVLIDQVAALLEADDRADMATLCTPIRDAEEFADPNVVKVVTAGDGSALYFSRAPIPHRRGAMNALVTGSLARRHLGLYAYRVEALLRFTSLPVSPLEDCEKLEQLRALEAGLRIAVAEACEEPGPGIDTPADIERARTPR